MKRVIISMLIIAISLFLLFILNKYLFKNTPTVAINDAVFKVHVAKSENQKNKGLSIYRSLAHDEGMVFPFEKEDYYSFWMKGMRFPIDIIYINNGKIVDIFKNVPYPKSSLEKIAIVRPREKSNFILEINAGLSDKYKLKIGDSVKTTKL